MRRVVAVVGVLLALQGVLWLAWRSRGSEEPFLVEAADGPAPALAPANGLLHVWATWCVPCRDELPGLLAEARDAGVPLVAVSIDENPASIEAFFGGAVPPEVARDPLFAAAVGVKELPATFVVREGVFVERVQGARDWRSEGARAWLDSRGGGK